MLSLEQVRALQDRVEKAVALIAGLRSENAELERRCSELQARAAEAQSFIDQAATELAASEEKTQSAEQKLQESEARVVELKAQRQADAAATAARVHEVEAKLTEMMERVSAAETRAAELSTRAEEYRRDQAKIEEGIVRALERLDTFEDSLLGQASGQGGNPEAATEESVEEKSDQTTPEAEKPSLAEAAGSLPDASRQEAPHSPEAFPDQEASLIQESSLAQEAVAADASPVQDSAREAVQESQPRPVPPAKRQEEEKPQSRDSSEIELDIF